MAFRTRIAAVLRRPISPQWKAGFRRHLADQPEAKVAAAPSPQSQIERIESKLPRFLHRFTRPLRTAPVSHVAAFLILHELTAVVPLFALTAFFHYSHWMPPYISEGRWVQAGTERFGKWLRKRGYIDGEEDRKSKWFGRGEGGVRLAVEMATAYAITKALLPLRLPLSIWLTPWFARWTVLPARNALSRMFRRKKNATLGVNASAGVNTTAATQTQKVAGSPKV